MEEPGHKFFGVVCSLLLLGQEAHKTGPRGSEVAIRIAEIRNQLIRNQLATQTTPHPDSRLTCPHDCPRASFKADCRDPSEDCLPHCDNNCDSPSTPWLLAICEADAWCQRAVATDCEENWFGERTTCNQHEWIPCPDQARYDEFGEGSKPRMCHRRRIPWDFANGMQVLVTKTYHDGPPELVKTQSYEEGLPGTIIREENRNGQCGVVIKFHGCHGGDNTVYPHSTFYEVPGYQDKDWKGIYRALMSHQDLHARDARDIEVFLPKKITNHLQRLETPNLRWLCTQKKVAGGLSQYGQTLPTEHCPDEGRYNGPLHNEYFDYDATKGVITVSRF